VKGSGRIGKSFDDENDDDDNDDDKSGFVIELTCNL